MTKLRAFSLALGLLLALTGCAATPRIETSFTGAVPSAATYELVDASRHYGTASDSSGIARCLAAAGLRPGVPATALVQVAHTTRPARMRVEPGEKPGAGQNGGKAVRSAKPREELVVAVSDAASGTLMMRASAARVLNGNGAAPADGALEQALCGAIPLAGAAR